MSYFRLISLSLALLALAVSACGNSTKSSISSSSSKPASTSITQSISQHPGSETASRPPNHQLTAKANSICRRTKARVAANSVPSVSGITLANSAERLSRSAGYEAHESRELLALASLAPDKTSWQGLAGGIQQISSDLINYASFVKTGKAQTLNNPLVEKIASDEEQVQTLAVHVKLKECMKFE